MPVSISEPNSCDTAATWVKPCTKTASSLLGFAHEGIHRARLSRVERRWGGRKRKEKTQPRHRKVWTLTLGVKWRCLEALATISVIPHTTEELLKASSTLGPSEKIPGVQKINRKRWRPHQHSCLCLVFTREAEASAELELERVTPLKSGHLKMQDGKCDCHPSTRK